MAIAGKRILVTGSQGMLGCSLVPQLRAAGHEVLELSRNGVNSLQVDLTDAARTQRALDQALPQVIVNLAALTNVDECERSPHKAYLANVHVVENLARWIRGAKSQCHLVQISTDQVYDGAGPHGEGAVTLTNYYGFSKYAGELAATTVEGTVLRTNFFGPSTCPGRSSLSDWLVHSLTSNSKITVFEDVQFSPLSLKSLVEQIGRVVGDPRRGIFNLGSREGMSKADFAFHVARLLNLPASSMIRGRSQSVALLAYRPKDMRMDSRAFESAYSVTLPTLANELQTLTRNAHAAS
jgi:dTDP-4-dehydrorhamnose reductase